MNMYRQSGIPRTAPLFTNGYAVWLDKNRNILNRRKFQKGERAVHINLDRVVTLNRCKDICIKFKVNNISIHDTRFYDLDNNKEYADDYLNANDGGYYLTIKKLYTYDKNENSLIIWENGAPVYANDNGIICRDVDALADTLL